MNPLPPCVWVDQGTVQRTGTAGLSSSIGKRIFNLIATVAAPP